MNIVFISNFLNHHQIPISNEFNDMDGVHYNFIAVEDVPEERVKMGYLKNFDYGFPYYINWNENKKEAELAISEANVVIFGSAPSILLDIPIRNQALIFIYSERIFKSIYNIAAMYLRGSMSKIYKRISNYNKGYLLCAGNYAAQDFLSLSLFSNKKYKWGYFPRFIKYDIDSLLLDKRSDLINILWVGRLIPFKNPEHALELAQKLKEKHFNFHLQIVGDGVLYDSIEKKIQKWNLNDCVSLLGAQPFDLVRSYMEKSNIFFLTSNRKEGWGAVINEAMNSGCAVVANYKIGSTTFLIQNNINGLLYYSKNELFQKMEELLNNHIYVEELGRKAYMTIENHWNPKKAAKNFIELSEQVAYGKYPKDISEDEPCSIIE